MKNEFRDAYVNLFENSFSNLRRIIQVKLKAIHYSNKYLMAPSPDHVSDGLDNMQGQPGLKESIMRQNIEKLQFEPIDQIEIENMETEICSSSDGSNSSCESKESSSDSFSSSNSQSQPPSAGQSSANRSQKDQK